jgi:hypothetical protein
VQHTSTFLGLIKKALRANYDKVADEPLPERWVELIHHLNERERAETDRHSKLHKSELPRFET